MDPERPGRRQEGSPLPLPWLVRAVCASCEENLSRDATVVVAREKMVPLDGRMMTGWLGGTHFPLATGCQIRGMQQNAALK